MWFWAFGRQNKVKLTLGTKNLEQRIPFRQNAFSGYSLWGRIVVNNWGTPANLQRIPSFCRLHMEKHGFHLILPSSNFPQNLIGSMETFGSEKTTILYHHPIWTSGVSKLIMWKKRSVLDFCNLHSTKIEKLEEIITGTLRWYKWYISQHLFPKWKQVWIPVLFNPVSRSFGHDSQSSSLPPRMKMCTSLCLQSTL